MSNSKYVNVVVPASPSNYTVGRSGRKIEAITIHHMAGRLTAEQCGRIFQNPNRKASSNYGIGYEGSVGLYVDEDNTSWCNSNWDSNCKSVTIEVSDNDNSWYVNDTTMEMLIKLVADIAKRNNLGKLVKGQNVTWHSMFANTTCPGDYLRSKIDYICDEANKINEEKPEIKYNLGDVVDINGVYVSSDSTEELSPAITRGKITRIIDGAKNPYLLDDGNIGWVNNDCIIGIVEHSDSDLLDIVRRTIRGDFGNQPERQKRIEELGYDYEEVRRQVNLNLEHGNTTWDSIRLY